MFRNAKVQMVAVVAIAALLGYLAGVGKLNPFQRANAAAPSTEAATGKAAVSSNAATPACCDQVNKSALVALADPKVKLAAGAQAGGKKPNILFIMGDDIGWFNIGAYHQGMMSGKTPNLDKLASQGMRFTDYYAEASCTAGRAAFIMGEIPLRTGMTTVGQAGADVGIPAQACTIATALKAQGYATGQFGKNHLGDLNKFLPTLHGFDEFFGYLYHLDAMSDPYWFSFPLKEAYYNAHGPRSLVHCRATDQDDPTVMPRWGKIGKQKIVDKGPLPPFPNMANVQNMHDIPFLKAKYDMTTFDEELVKKSCKFMDDAKAAGKSFFVWHNTTRMHSSRRNTRPCRTPTPTTALKRPAWPRWTTASARC
jgi:arylsulfatase